MKNPIGTGITQIISQIKAKNYLKINKFAGILIKNKNRYSSDHTNFLKSNNFLRDDLPSLSKNDSNISKKRNISPLSNFTTNYKTKKIGKGYIHRQKQNVSREINTSTPGIPLRSHLPISITISNGNGLKNFQKNTSFSAKYTKKGLKSSNMNSPSYAKSNATNFDFAINQNEQESIQKTKGDLRNYLKQNFINSPERHLQSQEDESRKQSLYQGGFVEDKEDEKLSEGE